MTYFAFCDPSGGSNDSMTLGIARTAMLGNKSVLVGCWEKKAPFNPDAVVEEFARTLWEYHLTTVVGDRYSAEWVKERFRAHGVTYVSSERTESQIYLEFLALVNSGRVSIPNNKRLRTQLASLERRTSRSGRDSVDHPSGGHDDLANCVAGALVEAAAGAGTKYEPICCFIELGGPGDVAERTEEDLRSEERQRYFFAPGKGNQIR